ncbi:hypothetical protein FOY91_04135 [Sphingomonas solaris]|uniref:Type IV secretion system coupling protein TraD DNA-binding domain-containing protein n=1 Tax=Alterirhizorhabdus solaris TaxID=2529389 RepID=A0A558RAW4_9SPHN|nr:hypothetical protein FOY91_04135 [Sphingomonas solaris]
MTLILRGSRDTIPPNILSDLIAEARAGDGRLVVVDEGEGLPARFADPDIDLLLDPARGNWDFFADHDCDHDRDMTRAAKAITAGAEVPPAALGLARRIIAELLHDVTRYSGADLAALSERVGTVGYDGVIVWMRALRLADDVDRDRIAWAVPAILADAGGFARRDPRMPLVGIRRRFAGSPRRILFIAAGEMHGACRSVAAAVACIVAHETEHDRTVRIATHRKDFERGEPHDAYGYDRPSRRRDARPGARSADRPLHHHRQRRGLAVRPGDRGGAHPQRGRARLPEERRGTGAAWQPLRCVAPKTRR